MKQILYRAYLDTISWFGGWSAAIPALLLPLIGLALHYLQAPSADVMEEWQTFLIYGLQAGTVIFAGSFAWNLACSPYRVERDRANRLALEVNKLRSNSSNVVQTRLSDLIKRGEDLKKRCIDGDAQKQEIKNWQEQTDYFLNNSISSLAASRFHSDSDTPNTVPTGNINNLNVALWQYLNRRLSKLEKIASELVL